jgi:hypothetical protein
MQTIPVPIVVANWGGLDWGGCDLEGGGGDTHEGVKFCTMRRHPRWFAGMSHLGSGWIFGHIVLCIVLFVREQSSSCWVHSVDMMKVCREVCLR